MKIKNIKLLVISTIPETRLAFFISIPLALAARAAFLSIHSLRLGPKRINKLVDMPKKLCQVKFDI